VLYVTAARADDGDLLLWWFAPELCPAVCFDWILDGERGVEEGETAVVDGDLTALNNSLKTLTDNTNAANITHKKINNDILEDELIPDWNVAANATIPGGRNFVFNASAGILGDKLSNQMTSSYTVDNYLGIVEKILPFILAEGVTASSAAILNNVPGLSDVSKALLSGLLMCAGARALQGKVCLEGTMSHIVNFVTGIIRSQKQKKVNDAYEDFIQAAPLASKTEAQEAYIGELLNLYSSWQGRQILRNETLQQLSDEHQEHSGTRAVKKMALRMAAIGVGVDVLAAGSALPP